MADVGSGRVLRAALNSFCVSLMKELRAGGRKAKVVLHASSSRVSRRELPSCWSTSPRLRRFIMAQLEMFLVFGGAGTRADLDPQEQQQQQSVRDTSTLHNGDLMRRWARAREFIVPT